jgi:hypothetical protein
MLAAMIHAAAADGAQVVQLRLRHQAGGVGVPGQFRAWRVGSARSLQPEARPFFPKVLLNGMSGRIGGW